MDAAFAMAMVSQPLIWNRYVCSFGVRKDQDIAIVQLRVDVQWAVMLRFGNDSP